MKGKKTKWTHEMDKQLRDLYAQKTANEVAEMMGLSKSAIKARIHRLNIVLSDEVRSQRKAAAQFNHGRTPYNKGKKQHEYMSPEAIERTRLTRFTRGHSPHNTLEDGVITIRTDKRGVPYQFIRLKKSIWIGYQVYVWQMVNGPVPEGYSVIFKDGNTMNCDLSNLELLSKADLMRKNTIHRYPNDLKQAIRALNQLTRKINSHGKK